MQAFWIQVFSGLATGGIYASVALGLVVIYKSTHHINFAQGEMAMFSTYVALVLINSGIPYWSAFAITVVLAFMVGALIDRFVLRPVQDRPILVVVIVMVGLLLIFNSLANWLFGPTVRTFPSPFPAQSMLGNLVSGHTFGTTAVICGLLAVIYLFFRYTPIGLDMRAAAQNPVSSRLVGIRVDRMRALGWGLAAALGAVAGMLIAPVIFLDPNMMSGVLIYGFAAAILGGIDNPGGAVLGGFLLGVLENLLGAYVIGTELKLTVALVVIVTVLLVKPAGLLGTTIVRRV